MEDPISIKLIRYVFLGLDPPRIGLKNQVLGGSRGTGVEET
jgi:hypothetical protein